MQRYGALDDTRKDPGFRDDRGKTLGSGCGTGMDPETVSEGPWSGVDLRGITQCRPSTGTDEARVEEVEERRLELW